MTPRSGLLACSNEVLTMIFNDPSLRKKDIKSLRLTSKELHPAATREFAMRYLTEPYVVLTKDSLQALVEICKHPLFSPYIQSIGFLTTTLCVGELGNFAGRLYSSNREHNRKHGGLVRDLATMNEYSELCIEQIQLENTGQGEELLVMALSALGRPFNMNVTNDPDSANLSQVLRLSKFMQRDGFHPRPAAEYRTRSLFGLIQSAITQVGSGSWLNSLGICLRRHYDSFPDITGSYTGIRELCFDIDAQTFRDQATISVFERLIRAAPNLEALSFAAGHVSKSPVASSTMGLVSDIFETLRTCRLQVIILQDVTCTLDSLLKLMERHKQTITRLRFVRVTLLGSWRDCLSWIRKELNLVGFHIYQVRALDPSRNTGKGTFALMPGVPKLTKTSFTGKDDTRLGLDGLAQVFP